LDLAQRVVDRSPRRRWRQGLERTARVVAGRSVDVEVERVRGGGAEQPRAGERGREDGSEDGAARGASCLDQGDDLSSRRLASNPLARPSTRRVHPSQTRVWTLAPERRRKAAMDPSRMLRWGRTSHFAAPRLRIAQLRQRLAPAKQCGKMPYVSARLRRRLRGDAVASPPTRRHDTARTIERSNGEV